MLSLEWRFVSLGWHGDFYMELGLFDSGKVICNINISLLFFQFD